MFNTDKHKKFSKIYDKYVEKIYRFIFLKVSSQETAEDLCSKVFIRYWNSFQDKECDIKNVQAFLYRIARNLIIDFYREKNRVRLVSTETVSQIIDPNQNLEEKAMLTSDVNMVKAVLANIKEDYREVIIWYYLDELSISEIARMLNKSEEATRVTLHRALKTLRQEVDRQKTE